MSQVTDTLKLLSENWFLQEPAFFALYCQQQLEENARMECALRCGQGRIEYNPLILAHKNYAEVEQLMRIELIRLFLKHPYERQPEGCCREAMTIGSDITIADGYCLLHKEKLPLRDPGYYHLPLGQYYEWYAKAIQNQSDDQDSRKNQGQSDAESNQNPDGGQSSNDDLHSGENQDKSSLWQEDSMWRERINELIERTTDWGTLPAEIVEKIKVSTKGRIDNRLIWQGFKSAIISCNRQLTRMRPNRRTGFLQMGSRRHFDTHLLVAIDVSGSINDTVLAEFFGSINRLFLQSNAQIDLCQFDVTMGDIVPMTQVKPEITVTGRGGTSFQPVIDYIQNGRHDYDGLLILTDGQAPPPSFDHGTETSSNRRIKTKVPILWVCQDKDAYETHHNWMKQSGRCCHL